MTEFDRGPQFNRTSCDGLTRLFFKMFFGFFGPELMATLFQPNPRSELNRVSLRMDFTEINSRRKRGELLGRIDRKNSRFRTAKTTIINFGLHASFVELESAKSALNETSQCVSRLWDQYFSEDSVSRRPVPGRPRATTPAEDRFLALSARRRRTTIVPQLVADHFQASGRRISATTVRNRLRFNAGLYARRPVVCVPLNGRQRRNRLCWAR
ncbi:HTH_Tnp_Tc3_2 domain-containing protein [Trichonephila clavipes]|nr:HTH_Tnp_Tc3_2 domain-containing protein [Trichonephila clavipes]